LLEKCTSQEVGDFNVTARFDFAAYSKHPIFGPMATPCETPAYVKQVKVKLDFLGLAKTLLHSGVG